MNNLIRAIEEINREGRRLFLKGIVFVVIPAGVAILLLTLYINIGRKK